MADYKPEVTFTIATGQSLSDIVTQFTRYALIAIQTPSTLTAPAASPTGVFFVQFRGAFTLAGNYNIIKNSSGIFTLEVQTGTAFSFAIDPVNFAGYPFVKAEIVEAAGGAVVPQTGAKTLAGKMYEV